MPLLRRNVRGDLRLAKRDYNEDLTVVSLSDKTAYTSYVPHGLVLSWNEEGQPVAAKGSQFGADGKRFHARPASVRVLSRMAKREARNQLRFLPMHLAMKGFYPYFSRDPISLGVSILSRPYLKGYRHGRNGRFRGKLFKDLRMPCGYLKSISIR